MYKIDNVTIEGFWGESRIYVEFNKDVNILIGKNGTGKTTFMDILSSILAVDNDGLFDNLFKKVVIKLSEGKKVKTVTVTKEDFGESARVIYSISKKSYEFHVTSIEEDRRYFFRRRFSEKIEKVKEELNSIVSLSSLSVYRYRKSDIDGVDREIARKYRSPVDMRLHELLQNLTKYQLEISQRSREVSIKLQKDVLTSLLYDNKEEGERKGLALEYSAEVEKEKLISAYKQLGISGTAITRKITEHVKSVDECVVNIKKVINRRPEEVDVEPNEKNTFNFAPLEASSRVQKVSDLSLHAEKEIESIHSSVNLFIAELSSFITDKTFAFVDGFLTIKNSRNINVFKLSSGEKQLLILLIEALLQREKPFIYLADEPELSLHIEWQRRIVPAVKKLNNRAQVIVATHSPEVASKYKESILNMRDITFCQG